MVWLRHHSHHRRLFTITKNVLHRRFATSPPLSTIPHPTVPPTHTTMRSFQDARYISRLTFTAANGEEKDQDVERKANDYDDDSRRHQGGNNGWNKNTFWAGVGITGTLAAAVCWSYRDRLLSPVEATLPIYSLDDVAKHDCMDEGVWVTYEEDIFDITEFVRNHPGGEKILLAAGKSVEPFWNLYTLHKTEDIKEILYSMRIGKLDKNEMLIKKRMLLDESNPYKHEPERHPVFSVNSVTPFDAEPPSSLLAHDFITPNQLFYVRNHLPVPLIDPQNYRLEVDVGKGKMVKLSLHDLKTKFRKVDVTATLQCAGNRRGEMQVHRGIYGAKAGSTAISNAKWSGARLRDVLLAAGMNEDELEMIEHVQFEGLDQDMSGEAYGASIPIEKAISSGGDVLLAYEMNDEELPRDHGYPIRVIIPGVVGARSVKWLGKIIASPEESPSFWQRLDYKSAPPWAVQGEWNFKLSPPIYESPVNSVICTPTEGDVVSTDEDVMTVKGYAFSGGGSGILRVDVSGDGGITWKKAELKSEKQRRYRQWAWTLWEIDLPVDGKKNMEIVVKAVDTHHNVQPETIESIWNLRGFLNNSWYRVKVKVEEKSES